MLKAFKATGCRMSLKIRMLHAHLDKKNMGVYSEEQGGHFRQDLKGCERWYQGLCNKRSGI